MQSTYWVKGSPATFATNGEKPWIRTIVSSLSGKEFFHNEIELEFVITEERFKKYQYDIDNLCEPVFTALVRNLGWYQYKRSNVKKWYAFKRIGVTEGVFIRNGINSHMQPLYPKEENLFDGVYQGKFPNHATDDHMPLWLKTKRFDTINGKSCSLHLQFGSEEISTASICGGKVKPLIDCLYPILGGPKGAPADHLVYSLLVEKGIAGLQKDQVAINIWSHNKS